VSFDGLIAGFASPAALRRKLTCGTSLVVIPEPFFITRREQLVAQAARLAIPVIYDIREFAVSGGLMTYGNYVAEGYRQIGIFAGKILKGAKPSDKFEFVINLKTAKALSLTIPHNLLVLADR
jgi:putative tryptophan/tyrosine transport system substrate-binding protein